MSMALAAVADNGNGFILQHIDVTIGLVVNFWHKNYLLTAFRGTNFE